MMKSRIKKGLTITLFVALLSAYVLNESGTFNSIHKLYMGSPNGTAVKDTSQDSIDSVQTLIMSSSKSAIIAQPQYINDSPAKVDSTHFKIMSSSKSRMIILDSSYYKRTGHEPKKLSKPRLRRMLKQEGE